MTLPRVLQERLGRMSVAELELLSSRPELLELATWLAGAPLNLLIASAPIMLAGAEGEVPAEVQLFSAGEWKTHPKGPFTVDEKFIDTMMANLERTPRPFVDREHETVLSPPGAAVDAIGWIKSARKGPDPKDPSRLALFGSVDWNELGRQAVGGKRYLYGSPGWFANGKDPRTGASIGPVLDHFSIVKQPFFEGMQSLTASSLFPGLGRADGEKTMNELRVYLAKLLKQPEGAEEAAILARARQLESGIADLVEHGAGIRLSSGALEALTLDGKSTSEVVSKAIVDMAARAKGNDDMAGRVAKLEQEKIIAAVQKARIDKLITPAEEPEQLELAKTNFPLWEKLLAKRSPIVAGKVETDPNAPRVLGDRLVAQQKAVDTFVAANPKASFGEALRACVAAQPELFAGQEGV